MKIFFKTLLFIIISLVIALAGERINYNFLLKSNAKKLLSEAETNFEEFERSYDDEKKTIIVIGRSTSLFSFRKGQTITDSYSFIDKLKEKNNVLKLSSTDLFNYDEVKVLLDFAQEKVPNPDLVIMENLLFFSEDEIFDGSGDLLLKVYCADNEVPKKLCERIQSVDFDTDEFRIFDNPCDKKYADRIAAAYMMYPLERAQYVKDYLLCGKSSGYLPEAKIKMTHLFQEGEAMELPDESQGELGIERIPVAYKDWQLLYINKNLSDMMNNYSFSKVLVMPALAKNTEGLSTLPVFQKFPERLLYIDFSEKIFHNKKDYNTNFPDGAHPSVEIQDYTAEKIQNYLDERR